MDCKTLRYSRHAFERMFQRKIEPEAVTQIIAQGEIIATYPEDQPFASVLLLGFSAGIPVHAVVAQEPETADCHLVTIYLPDPTIWDETFKKRKTR
jgi:hypothetical protein